MNMAEGFPIVVVTCNDLKQIRHHVEHEQSVVQQGQTIIGMVTSAISTPDPLSEDYQVHERLLGMARELLDYIESTIDTYAEAILDHGQFLSFLRFVLDAVGRRKVRALSFLDLLDTPEFSYAVARHQPVILRLATERSR